METTINKLSKNKSQGFTIVELLIASGVFSTMIIVAGFTIIQIGKLYYKGVTVTKTQTVARTVLDDITRPIQLSNASVSDGPMINTGAFGARPVRSLCVGSTRYTYVLGVQSGIDTPFNGEQIRHALWQDELESHSACLTAALPVIEDEAPGGVNGKDLLGEKMWLEDLTVEQSTIDNDLWKINVSVIYGDRDLMDPVDGAGVPTSDSPTGCRGAIAGSQWCSHVTYNTMVFKRINDSDST